MTQCRPIGGSEEWEAQSNKPHQIHGGSSSSPRHDYPETWEIRNNSDWTLRFRFEIPEFISDYVELTEVTWDGGTGGRRAWPDAVEIVKRERVWNRERKQLQWRWKGTTSLLLRVVLGRPTLVCKRVERDGEVTRAEDWSGTSAIPI